MGEEISSNAAAEVAETYEIRERSDGSGEHEALFITQNSSYASSGRSDLETSFVDPVDLYRIGEGRVIGLKSWSALSVVASTFGRSQEHVVTQDSLPLAVLTACTAPSLSGLEEE